MWPRLLRWPSCWEDKNITTRTLLWKVIIPNWAAWHNQNKQLNHNDQDSLLRRIDPGKAGCFKDPNSPHACFHFSACFTVEEEEVVIMIILTKPSLCLISLVTCVTVPIMLNDTDTFSGTKHFRYRYRYFFGTKFFDTSSETFSGTKFFQYRFPYHQKNEQFPVQVPIVNLLNS